MIFYLLHLKPIPHYMERNLYERALAGEFGDVAEYVAPIIIESGE